MGYSTAASVIDPLLIVIHCIYDGDNQLFVSDMSDLLLLKILSIKFS